jgi:hypothetical protein
LRCARCPASRLKHLAYLRPEPNFSCFGNHPDLESRLTYEEKRVLAPTVLVLIVGLKDADKIGHAGSIAIFVHSRNLSIGRGLAPLPKPH